MNNSFTPFSNLKDIANVENEITMVEHKMSENNLAAKRFKEEMDYLQQLWQQQEMLIQTLEAENVEGELHQLVEEENRSEAELQEVKHKLAHCEQQLEHCKQQICDLMDKINEEAGKPLSSDHLEVDDEKAMIDKLQMAIGEKNKELELQVNGFDLLMSEYILLTLNHHFRMKISPRSPNRSIISTSCYKTRTS